MTAPSDPYFWIAQSGHVAWGALGVLGARALFPRQPNAPILGAAAILGVAGIKEFGYDHAEWNETMRSSAIDFSFYLLGAAAAFVVLWAANPRGVKYAR